MKKIMLVLVSLVFMGCALDSANQEEHKAKYRHPRDEKVIIVKEYYDENGDQITDPDIIAEIESKN